MTRHTSACLVVALALIGNCGAARGQTTLTAPDVMIAPGETSTLEIAMSQAPGIAALSLDIEFDADVLEATAVRIGEFGAGMMMDASLNSPGVVIVNMATAGDGPQGEGVLLEIDVRGRAKSGTATSLEFTNVEAWRSDTREAIEVATVSGRVRIGQPLPWSLLLAISGGVVALLLLLVLAIALLRRPRRANGAIPKPPPVAPSSGGTAFCTECGTALPGNAKFCGECGKPVRPPC